MSYTITAVSRCPVRERGKAQCALSAGHLNHHVTVGGLHFATEGGQVVAPKLPAPSPFAVGDRVLGQSFDQWAQEQGLAPAIAPTPAGFAIAITDGRGIIGKSAYSVSDLLERNQQRADEFAEFKAGVEKTLEHLADQASRHANTLGALGQTCNRLERALDQEIKRRESLSAELVKTRSGWISPLEDVAAGLRRDLNRLIGMTGDSEVWNKRKQLATSEALQQVSDLLYKRVDGIQNQLDDTTVQGRISAEAIERLVALEQRFEVPQAAWGIQSSEPPRHQTYQDADGDLWQCRDGRWRCVRGGGTWTMGEDGFTWPFPNYSVNHKYFPWKVWNGRD